MSPQWLPAAAAGVLLVILPVSAPAQTISGSVSGRVFNSATQEYVRNVEVSVEGTARNAISEEAGYYQLLNVSAGPVTLVTSYPGHASARMKVFIEPGTAATCDLTIAPVDAPRMSDAAVRLEVLVVSAERDGQAKALADQRNAMNVKTVMASDNFGEIAEGNIGEFLKFMPGVVLDYLETIPRTARIGGMEARYGYVTIDGNTLANGSSSSFGTDTRQFEFEAISISNIESVEVNRTLSADMSGDAPAGTINLRTKSAFDRERRHFSYTVGLIGNQYEHALKRTPRHDDGLHAKARPTAAFDFSDTYFGRKLGLSLNAVSTNVFKEQFRHSLAYSYTTAAAMAAGQPLITAINFKDGPTLTEKTAAGLKLEYRPFPELLLALTSSYAYYDDTFINRNLGFVVGSSNIAPGSSMTKIVALPSGANTATRLDLSGVSDDRRKDTTHVSLGFKFRRNRLRLDGLASYSRSREHRGGLQDNMAGEADLRLTRIGWTAERGNVDSPAWNFTQTSGPGWADLANYGRSDLQANNITGSLMIGKTEEYTAKLDARYAMNWKLPTDVKLGMSGRVTTRARKQIIAHTSTYVGPTKTAALPNGNQLNAPMPVSSASFLIATPWGGNADGFPVPNKEALGVLTERRPEYFVQTEANLAGDLDDILGSPQSNQEEVRALYFLENTRLGKWQVQAGLRLEATRTISTVMEEVPANLNPFAIVGTTVAGGVTRKTYTAAATRDYVRYKNSPGATTGYGSYHGWLPSASAKYAITQNLNLKLGYNRAVKRPNLNNIAGPWRISLNNATGDVEVTVPNPELKPEHSDKLSAVVEYYFEPAGTFSVHAFQTQLANASDETAPVPAADFGYGSDPVYGSGPYYFVTFANLDGGRRIRGIEFSYSQQFAFFSSELLRGIGVFGSYSRYTASPRPRDGRWSPQNATAGFSWRYRKFNANINGTWLDEIPTGSNTVAANSRYFPGDQEFLQERFMFDVGFGYKLAKHTSFFISGRNAFNSGKTWYYKSDGRIRQMERYGGQWTVGVTGKY
ncbi:MAG TPA: TonB-dependent receptor [Opitutaceae bacterium]|nr:TonB-dependent receptor [Opitutaceae bacterium]